VSIQTTDAHHVSLFDSVTGIAFGPVFDDVPEAEAFLRWTEGGGWKQGTVTDPKYWDKDQQKEMATAWRTFQTYHTEAECPYDNDVEMYGRGFIGDDYSCSCECHKRPGGVFAAGGRR
jgi:hypothetical protein